MPASRLIAGMARSYDFSSTSLNMRATPIFQLTVRVGHACRRSYSLQMICQFTLLYVPKCGLRPML